MRQSSKKRIRITLGIVVLLILSCLIWGVFIEPNHLIVRQETIQIENWPKEFSGLRIALVADIHTGGPFIDDKKLQRIVELANQQNPDLIVLLGDYMSPNSWHSRRGDEESARAAGSLCRAGESRLVVQR